MTTTLVFIYLFIIAPSFIYFVDATAAATSVGGRSFDVNKALSSDTYHQDEDTRQFIEEDYVSLMTNYENDERYLRGRKLQDNVDYQEKPYYQSQQQTHRASRGQIITLAIVVTLTATLAVYSAVLYREFAAITLYNILGYRIFGDSDERQGGSGEQEGVEIS